MHLDSDDFFWEAADPPYTRRRPTPERQQRLSTAFTSAPDGWSLSGWMDGWGDMFIPQVQVAIFIHLPPRLRPERLQACERQRYGAAIAEGGTLFQTHRDFLAWAAGYDSNTASRNQAEQEAWLASLPCPVLRLENVGTKAETQERALKWLHTLSG